MGPIFQFLSSVPGEPVPSRGAVAHLGQTRSVGAASGLLQEVFPLFPQSSACPGCTFSSQSAWGAGLETAMERSDSFTMPPVCVDLLPPRQVLDVSPGPVARREQGFCWRRFAPAVPAAEQRRCVPFPRGGTGTLRPGQGCAGARTQRPRGCLEPTVGTTCVQVVGHSVPAHAFAQ